MNTIAIIIIFFYVKGLRRLINWTRKMHSMTKHGIVVFSCFGKRENFDDRSCFNLVIILLLR